MNPEIIKANNRRFLNAFDNLDEVLKECTNVIGDLAVNRQWIRIKVIAEVAIRVQELKASVHNQIETVKE